VVIVTLTAILIIMIYRLFSSLASTIGFQKSLGHQLEQFVFGGVNKVRQKICGVMQASRRTGHMEEISLLEFGKVPKNSRKGSMADL
jgi:hypothetical protein